MKRIKFQYFQKSQHRQEKIEKHVGSRKEVPTEDISWADFSWRQTKYLKKNKNTTKKEIEDALSGHRQTIHHHRRGQTLDISLPPLDAREHKSLQLKSARLIRL